MRSLSPVLLLLLPLGCQSGPIFDPGDPRVPADLDADGLPELVFAHTSDGDDYSVDSRIYWSGDYSQHDALDTTGAMGIEIADLDRDGFPELVFNQVSDGEERLLDSLIFWGSSGGYSSDDTTGLPTVGCADVTVSDVDLDGWLDLVFTNRYDGSSLVDGYYVDAAIYWNDSGSFSADDRTDLPVHGAARSRVADLDGDGFRDIVFANATFAATASVIYWGSEEGFSEEQSSELPTDQPEGLEVADLDGDGWLDLIFGEWCSLASCETHSLVYWGSEQGFDPSKKLRLDTLGATDADVADFNADGHQDLLFTNSFSADWGSDTESWLYWGSEAGWSEEDRSALPSVGSSESAVLDLDGDGWLEIVMANFYSLEEGDEPVSWIYWGSVEGYSVEARSDLPSSGAGGVEGMMVTLEP